MGLPKSPAYRAAGDYDPHREASSNAEPVSWQLAGPIYCRPTDDARLAHLFSEPDSQQVYSAHLVVHDGRTPDGNDKQTMLNSAWMVA
jgi:hypothetical protein